MISLHPPDYLHTSCHGSSTPGPDPVAPPGWPLWLGGRRKGGKGERGGGVIICDSAWENRLLCYNLRLRYWYNAEAHYSLYPSVKSELR